MPVSHVPLLHEITHQTPESAAPTRLQKVITRPAVQMEGLSRTALLCAFTRSALGRLNPRPDVRSSYDGHSAFAASPDLPDAPLLTPAAAGHPRRTPSYSESDPPSRQPSSGVMQICFPCNILSVDGCRIWTFMAGPMVPWCSPISQPAPPTDPSLVLSLPAQRSLSTPMLQFRPFWRS